MNRLFGFLGASLSAVIFYGAAQAQCPWSYPPAIYPSGPNPFHVVVADFDNDGVQDLAITNYGPSLMGDGPATIGVYRGDGSGGFAGQITNLVPRGISHLVAVDFNLDGNLDVATNSVATDAVSVLYGRGDGTFESVVAYAAGDGPYGVASADFNADGVPDLAVASNLEDRISILRGLAAGGFAAPLKYPAGMDPYDIRVGDFNEDGISDLVVTNSLSHDISIFIGLGNSGQGNGTFAPQVRYAAQTNPYGVASADFDGDGITDLAVANGGSGTVTLFKGHGTGGVGDGTFEATLTIAGLGEPRSVIVADLDPDGIKDLVVADYGGGGNGFIRLLRGVGNGTFHPPASVPAGLRPTDVALGNFNADGLPDIAVPNFLTYEMRVFLGTCETTRVPAPSAAPATLSLARVAWNGSAGALTVSLSLPRAGSASFEVFDVNGRRVGEERLEGLGAGEHELSVRPSRTLDPGVFFARVTQDGKGASRRFIVVK